MRNAIAILILTTIVFNSVIVGQTDRKLERQVSTTQTGKRLALVIGNGRYQNVSTLDNPVNDANDMAAALQNLGFEVIKGTDANLVQMRRLIREFGEKLEAQKGIGLFFYAGHGVEVRGKNFLIPVDADISREVETEDYAIEVNAVLRQMDAANNGFNIVILDACRNNPFSRGWNRSGDAGGLANVNAPTGTYIAYAAAPGTTASDGKGTRNGIFTGALLKNLKRPNLKLEEVFKLTREEVMTLTGNRQVPWDSSSIKGDFFFSRTDEKQPTVAANTEANTDPTIVAKNAAQQEQEAWNLVKNSSDAEDFRFFLKEFPAGANAGSAKIRLEELVWQSVKSSNDKAKVQEYLTEFPNGANAAAARIRLRQLDAAVNTPTTSTTTTTAVNTNAENTKPTSKVSDPMTEAANGEAALWRTIENSTETAKFENYLSRVKSGEFAGTYKADAELKLSRLKNPNFAVWARLSGTANLLLKYKFVQAFSDDLILVANGPYFYGSLKGLIDKTGKEILPLKYSEILPFSEGLAAVKNRDYGFIDKTGKEVIPIKYGRARSFSEGLALVWNGKWGFIDKTGKEVIPIIYEDAGSFSEGLAPVRTNETRKWGFIDKTGKMVIPAIYDEARSFSEGLAAVQIGDKWGFIDKTGKEVIPIKSYYTYYSFSEGLANVRIGETTGFIDKTGKEVIPFNYRQTYSFSEGLASVERIDGRWVFIDKTGKEALPDKYEYVGNFSEGLVEVKMNGKYGFIDRTGKEIIPVKYDEVWTYAFKKEGFYGVVLNGKKGFVDIYGNEYFDF